MKDNLPEFQGEKGFTLRAAIIASLTTIFLLASSSYIALKIGALPWPIIFSVVICSGILGLLSIFKKTNIHEINVAQAGASIGGLMASALVFVIPGVWYLQKQGIALGNIRTLPLILVCIAGGILGILLSIPLRRIFIDKENLPYPSGTAGAETLLSVKKGKKYLLLLIFIGALAGMFALTRDVYFASGFSLSFLASAGIFFTIYPMPLAVGVGYILGKKNSFSWFLGALVGWIIIIPLLIKTGFQSKDAILLTQNLGMGLVLGSGIGFLIIYILPKIKKIFKPLFNFSKDSPWYFKLTPFLSLFTIFLLWLIKIPLIPSIVAVIGVWIIVAVAARMTGETNIDPLEQFGIVIGLLAIIIYSFFSKQLGYEPAFIIVCFVSVVAAIAGDIHQDYKSAKIIKTRPYDIIKVDLIAVIVAAIFGPLILEVIRRGFFDIIFTELMPAPQSQMVAGAIFGFPYPKVFLIGFGIAMILEAVYKLIKKKQIVSIMPFGIGLFLGLGISFMLFIGGILKLLFGKNKKLDYPFFIGSAGLMGGEGIAGFIAAALFVFGIISYVTAAKILFIIFLISAIIAAIIYFRGKNNGNRN